MNWDKIYDTIINKFHIVLGAGAQGAVFFYQYHTGHDIGENVRYSLWAFYGFLGGHALTYQKYPDQPQPEADASKS